MPRHPTKEKPPSAKETLNELWRYAHEVAVDIAADIADQYQLPYRWAFGLYEFTKVVSWNTVMEMTHNKGWHMRHYWHVRSEAEKLGYKLHRWLRTADEAERQRLMTEVDEALKRRL